MANLKATCQCCGTVHERDFDSAERFSELHKAGAYFIKSSDSLWGTTWTATRLFKPGSATITDEMMQKHFSKEAFDWENDL